MGLPVWLVVMLAVSNGLGIAVAWIALLRSYDSWIANKGNDNDY